MDERERMRAGLAEKAMGWTVDDSHFGYYRNANGGTIGTPHNGDLTRDDWQPDESWEQCGLVIEAMRAKGWDWSVEEYPDDIIGICLHKDGRYVWGDAEDERYARMMTAAIALEATDD